MSHQTTELPVHLLCCIMVCIYLSFYIWWILIQKLGHVELQPHYLMVKTIPVADYEWEHRFQSVVKPWIFLLPDVAQLWPKDCHCKLHTLPDLEQNIYRTKKRNPICLYYSSFNCLKPCCCIMDTICYFTVFSPSYFR